MHQVKDEPMETVHLYVVREGQKRPSLAPVIIPIFVLSFLIAIGVLTPYLSPSQRATIRVPAVPLPLKTWSVVEPVMATGLKTFPATHAQGTLTITNGSVIAQELPEGLLFFGRDGVEVATTAAVFVPAGSAAGYGIATVSARAMASGKAGDIPALDIDSVEGSSIYIRNLQPFTGGQDAASVKFVTPQDTQTALEAARVYLTAQMTRVKAILEHPCTESASFGNMLRVTWVCRFVAYPKLPGFHVTGFRIAGKTLLVDVIFAARPRPFPGK
jgi:hypothetical protein